MEVSLATWLTQLPESDIALRQNIQRLLDIVTIDKPTPELAMNSEHAYRHLDNICSDFTKRIHELCNYSWVQGDNDTMENFKLPFKSVDCATGCLTVSGQMEGLGSGILSYHTNYYVAAENAKAINRAGGEASVEAVESAFSLVDKINTQISHYKWLDKHLNEFWQQVFSKNLNDTQFAGIVSAYGDKGYGYMSDWAEAGICFPHGVALYLLTYTDEMDPKYKHNPKEWVIDNFFRYRELMGNVNMDDPDILK